MVVVAEEEERLDHVWGTSAKKGNMTVGTTSASIEPAPMESPAPAAPARSKPPIGIAAGAEDAKYQVKYKELKRKVKDIEAVSPSSQHCCPCSPSSRTTTSCT